MEIDNTNNRQIIRKLKNKALFLKFIIILFLTIIIAGTIFLYYYTKPYIEKYNEFVNTFESLQPAINQLDKLSQSSQLSLLGISSKDLKTASVALNSLSNEVKNIQNTTNYLKNNFKWIIDMLYK
jgi:predicted PurR-regulated permease PerM